MSIFQELHDSEINGRISCFYDSQWRAELGDDMNGWKATRDADTFAGAEKALAEMACVYYPDSDFAAARQKPV